MVFFVRIFSALVILVFVSGCDHPLQIEGQGDIVSVSGARDCRVEDQPCGNMVVGQYTETYTAVPRSGWRFDRWEGCSVDTGPCVFNVDENTVLQNWGATAPALVARFEPVQQLERPQVESQPEPIAPTPAPALRVLVLGDSITQAGNGHPGYRRELWFLLQAGGYDVDFIGSHRAFHNSVPDKYRDFDLDHEGHWGWEAGEVKQQLSGWLSGYTPDLVLMHLGTNDFDRGQSNASTISELGAIIDKLRQDNPKVTILLATTIPMKDKDTSSLNREIVKLAQSRDKSTSRIKIVDQYSGYNPYTDNYDKWHPNSAGEEKMADKWYAAMRPFLGR